MLGAHRHGRTGQDDELDRFVARQKTGFQHVQRLAVGVAAVLRDALALLYPEVAENVAGQTQRHG